MGLFILRAIFIVITCGVGMYAIGMHIAVLGVLLFAGLLVGIDMLIPRKRVIWISSIYFGVLVATLLTAAIGYALTPLLEVLDDKPLFLPMMVILEVSLCYLCISFLVQTRNDLRFIIPYVELRREVKGSRQLILDAGILIDGRIADVLETSVLNDQLVIPRFVADELQNLSGSAEQNRQSRGKRGMDVLHRLQKMKEIDLRIDDTDMPEFQDQPVAVKLIELAKHLAGTLMTNDYNLSKIAKEQNVGVINLNDLANALKPAFFAGEKLTVELIKPGEEANQGVGYLDDGTMVVVEEGQGHIGSRVMLTVSSVLQTSAGRMIFGRYENTVKGVRR